MTKLRGGGGFNYNSSLQMGQTNRNAIIPSFSSTHVPNRRMLQLWASKKFTYLGEGSFYESSMLDISTDLNVHIPY